MMKRVKEWFDDLSPKAKKTLIYLGVAVVVLVFSLNLYKSRQQGSLAASPEKIEAVALDKNLLERTELAEYRRRIDSMGTELQNLKNQQRQLLERLKSEKKERTSPKKTPDTLPRIPTSEEIEKARIPTPPGTDRQLAVPLAHGVKGTFGANTQEKKTIGEIKVISNPLKPEEKKKKERTVYLPPSFMSAILLTGLDAATSSSGRSNPDPVLLRIQTPAVLPNDVKANLAGCFVVGEGQGRLDKERVDVRLISLSCLSNEGKAVIDSKVKGFVTDADAKTGLAGHVVSRMGASAARALVAGLFAGAGEMLKMQSSSISTSGLGSVTTVDPSKVGAYAIGSGLASGAQNLSDFYLTLAKQATPVVEANAGKHVTVVISEGTQLIIKDLPQSDDDLTTNEDY